MTGYIILFVIVVAIIDIILTGALAKWAILAPVFVPLFMRLGGDPNLVLAAYRVGDSPMNVITPLNVYLAVMVGFAQKYQKDAGIGTIVALMLPYTVRSAGALDGACWSSGIASACRWARRDEPGLRPALTAACRRTCNPAEQSSRQVRSGLRPSRRMCFHAR